MVGTQILLLGVVQGEGKVRVEGPCGLSGGIGPRQLPEDWVGSGETWRQQDPR